MYIDIHNNISIEDMWGTVEDITNFMLDDERQVVENSLKIMNLNKDTIFKRKANITQPELVDGVVFLPATEERFEDAGMYITSQDVIIDFSFIDDNSELCDSFYNYAENLLKNGFGEDAVKIDEEGMYIKSPKGHIVWYQRTDNNTGTRIFMTIKAHYFHTDFLATVKNVEDLKINRYTGIHNKDPEYTIIKIIEDISTNAKSLADGLEIRRF